MNNIEHPLLDIRDLRVSFPGSAGTPAVNGLAFKLRAGEALGLVGESGCGKSTAALSLMRLLPQSARLEGEIIFEGRNIVDLGERDMRALRGNRISMIFQEPATSLNPVMRIGEQIAEVVRQHSAASPEQARARALELLSLVHLPDPEGRIDDYPHQFSGGQKQRVMIAMAIACNPVLLIADEPTTALDATIQAQILALLDELRRKLGMAMVLISHDLSVVSRWTDKVVVMHHGEKMEALPAAKLLTDGQHPYTRGLAGASIRLDQDLHYRNSRLSEIRVTRSEAGQYDFSLSNSQPERLSVLPDRLATPVLEGRNIVVEYNTKRGPVTAVDDISFRIAPGETLGLVGESGSGKSTLARAVMRLVPTSSGQILLNGTDIAHARGEVLRQSRRQVQMVFQDPFSSLNPRHSIGYILETPLAVHEPGNSAERRKRVLKILDQVGLPSTAVDRFPHEFSGGQRQRIGIARALILKPSVLICDEAVSALDVSVQAQILNLLADLKAEFGLSYLFISHDLAVVKYVSDRVVVMKDARVEEENDHREIWSNPKSAYTRRLIAASEGMVA